MNGKKNQIQYGLIKIIKKTNSSILFLANKNFMSFKNLILQIDLTKISEKERKELKMKFILIHFLIQGLF